MHLCPIPRLGGELTTSLQIRPRAMFFFFFQPVTESVTEFFFPFPKELSMVEKCCKQA
jgi:hypothetical protein